MKNSKLNSKNILTPLEDRDLIYEKYGENIEDILTFLNYDVNNDTIDRLKCRLSLEDFIQKEVLRGTTIKKRKTLKEIYYLLINKINGCLNEKEITNIFITLVNQYHLKKIEISELKQALVRYIRIMKEYHKLDVALTENFIEKCRKIKKYHLTKEEVRESYYITFEFDGKRLIDKNSMLYYRKQLLRQYIIDWEQYSDIEKQKIKRENNITQEESDFMDKILDDINNVVSLYKKK